MSDENPLGIITVGGDGVGRTDDGDEVIMCECIFESDVSWIEEAGTASGGESFAGHTPGDETGGAPSGSGEGSVDETRVGATPRPDPPISVAAEDPPAEEAEIAPIAAHTTPRRVDAEAAADALEVREVGSSDWRSFPTKTAAEQALPQLSSQALSALLDASRFSARRTGPSKTFELRRDDDDRGGGVVLPP